MNTALKWIAALGGVAALTALITWLAVTRQFHQSESARLAQELALAEQRLADAQEALAAARGKLGGPVSTSPVPTMRLVSASRPSPAATATNELVVLADQTVAGAPATTHVLPVPTPVPLVSGSAVRFRPVASHVKIEGTSSIHDWTMESEIIGGFLESSPPHDLLISTMGHSKRPDSNIAVTAEIKIPVSSLKSYAKKMDEVMQEAMDMAHHRTIIFNVQTLAYVGEAGDAAKSIVCSATGPLVIKGVTNHLAMPVVITHTKLNTLRIRGSVPLKMSNFGIRPPAPELPMATIQTGDEVTVTFEWTVVVDNSVARR